MQKGKKKIDALNKMGGVLIIVFYPCDPKNKQMNGFA